MIDCSECKHSYIDDLFYEWQCWKNHRIPTEVDEDGVTVLAAINNCNDFENDTDDWQEIAKREYEVWEEEVRKQEEANESETES